MIRNGERVEEIDYLRGIAAILMILGHSFIVYPIDISNETCCSAIQHWIYTFHMELFFVVAGMVYRCTDYKRYILNKVKRIVVPYFFWGTISMLLHVFGGAMVNGTVTFKEGIIKLLFKGGDYWFLYTIFLLYAIYPIIDRYIYSIKRKTFFVICTILLGTFFSLSDTLVLDNIVYYIPYFMLGCMFRTIRRDISRLWIGLSSLLVYWGVELCFMNFELEDNNCFMTIRAIAMIIFIYTIVMQLKSMKESRVLNAIKLMLGQCSKYSLQLYLFNGYLLVIFRILICNIMHIENAVIIVSGIWGGNILVTLFICKYIVPRKKLFMRVCGL